MPDQTPTAVPATEMCSCPSTTVIRIHSSGSYCGDMQHERLAEELAARESLNLDVRGDPDCWPSGASVVSVLLDALRKEPAPVPMPAPVVRSDRIERAAQVMCDSSPHGLRWVNHGEPFRDIYRARARALAAAGLLADATPAEQPVGDLEAFMILDAAGDLVLVDLTDDGVLLGAPQGALLNEDQADDVSEAIRIRAAARRAAMKAGGGSRG